LCFEQSPKNSFKRLYIVRGCCFWSKKLRFRKNFDANFNAVVRVRDCAEKCSSSVQKFTTVRAIDVTSKTFVERFYLVLGFRKFAPCPFSLCLNYRETNFPEWPLNFSWPCDFNHCSTIHHVIKPPVECTGTRTDYLVDRANKKNSRKSRNNWCMNGRDWGCIRTVDAEPKCAQSWIQIQRLKDFLCYHIYCAHLFIYLHQIVTDLCIVPNRKSVPSARRPCLQRRETFKKKVATNQFHTFLVGTRFVVP